MRQLLLALSVLLCMLISSCTQWGTYALNTSHVWWACTDRYSPCSLTNASLTLIQMDNTYSAARGDFYANGGTDDKLTTPDYLEPLRDVLLIAASKRQLISNKSSPVWNDALADYVQATIDAEKVARRLTWR